jgi:hypothetical protein
MNKIFLPENKEKQILTITKIMKILKIKNGLLIDF